MSQVVYQQDDLHAFLVEHQDAFETLTDHDDEQVAEVFGEFPLRLLDELEDEQ